MSAVCITNYICKGVKNNKELLRKVKQEFQVFNIFENEDYLEFSVETKNNHCNSAITAITKDDCEKMYYLVNNTDMGILFTNDVSAKYFKFDFIVELNTYSYDKNINGIELLKLFSKVLNEEDIILENNEIISYELTEKELSDFLNEVNIELLDDRYRNINIDSISENYLAHIFDTIFELTGIEIRAWYLYRLLE